MNLVVVCGSQRKDSQSLKVARFLGTSLVALGTEPPYLLDLGTTPLPFLHSEEWDATGAARWDDLSRKIHDCAALVMVTPEWGGMATPATKNFFLLCASGQLHHKPVLLVSVSASQNGAYPIAELRMTAGKNSHACFIPEHVIVRDVKSVLNSAASASEADGYLRQRLDYALAVLIEYAKALTPLRTSELIRLNKYPNGM